MRELATNRLFSYIPIIDEFYSHKVLPTRQDSRVVGFISPFGPFQFEAEPVAISNNYEYYHIRVQECVDKAYATLCNSYELNPLITGSRLTIGANTLRTLADFQKEVLCELEKEGICIDTPNILTATNMVSNLCSWTLAEGKTNPVGLYQALSRLTPGGRAPARAAMRFSKDLWNSWAALLGSPAAENVVSARCLDEAAESGRVWTDGDCRTWFESYCQMVALPGTQPSAPYRMTVFTS